MVDLFLIPFYLFKYVFSFLIWLFLASVILDSDWFFRTKEWVIDQYNRVMERWND